MTRFFQKIIFAATLVLPFAVSAALPATPTNLTEFVNNFIYYTNIIVPFIIAFGMFGLIVGLMKYSGAGANEERRGKARELIIYGLIGMVVMFSFWGLVHILTKTYLGV